MAAILVSTAGKKYNIFMATMQDIMNRKLKRIRTGVVPAETPLPEMEDDRLWRKFRLEWRPLLESLGVLVLATGAAALLDSLFEQNNNVSIIYTLAVVIIASIAPGYI